MPARQQSLNQTLRGAATLTAYDPTATSHLWTASSWATFGKRVRVLPGTSGLNPGDPVTFTVQLSVDGFVGAGRLNLLVPGFAIPIPENARSLASVNASLSYRIRDLDQPPPCGECRPPLVLDFGYAGHVDFDAHETSWAGAEGHVDSSWSPDGTWLDGATSANPYHWTYQQGTGLISDLRADDQLTFSANSGLRSFTVNTFVGNTLEITGSLDVFVQAMGNRIPSQASGFFAHSFDAGFASADGLAFSNEVPGIQPVPEPGAWVLWLGGLVALAALRRQRS